MIHVQIASQRMSHQGQLFQKIVYITLGVLGLTITANIVVPLCPVPVTLHTFGVILLAFVFTRGLALQTLSAYFLCGALGMPVYTHFSSGLPVLIGPWGGYFLGFFLSVYLIGFLKEKVQADNWTKVMFYSFLGSIVISVSGALWLSYFIGFEKAIALGIMPFIVLDSIKILLVWATLRIIGCEK